VYAWCAELVIAKPIFECTQLTEHALHYVQTSTTRDAVATKRVSSMGEECKRLFARNASS